MKSSPGSAARDFSFYFFSADDQSGGRFGPPARSFRKPGLVFQIRTPDGETSRLPPLFDQGHAAPLGLRAPAFGNAPGGRSDSGGPSNHTHILTMFLTPGQNPTFTDSAGQNTGWASINTGRPSTCQGCRKDEPASEAGVPPSPTPRGTTGEEGKSGVCEFYEFYSNPKEIFCRRESIFYKARKQTQETPKLMPR
jgi:hypothetical protein